VRFSVPQLPLPGMLPPQIRLQLGLAGRLSLAGTRDSGRQSVSAGGTSRVTDGGPERRRGECEGNAGVAGACLGGCGCCADGRRGSWPEAGMSHLAVASPRRPSLVCSQSCARVPGRAAARRHEWMHACVWGATGGRRLCHHDPIRAHACLFPSTGQPSSSRRLRGACVDAGSPARRSAAKQASTCADRSGCRCLPS